MSPQMSQQLALALALEGRIDVANGQTKQLLSLVETLNALPDPEIDETFAASLEARLMNDGLPVQSGRVRLMVVPEPVKTVDEPLPSNVVQMPQRRMVVRRSVASLVAAAMLAAFPLVAAASAIPGSPFYSVKRAMERLELAVFGGPVADGFKNLQFSHRRLEEAAQVSSLGGDAGTVTQLLRDARASMQAGTALILGNTTDRATLTRLGDWARATERQMAAVASSMGADANAVLAGSMAITRQIQVAVANALGSTVVAPADVVGRSLDGTTTEQPAVGSRSAASSSQESSDGSGGSAQVRKPAGTPSGHGKQVREATGGCQIPGRANGLGDTLAVTARLVCETADTQTTVAQSLAGP